LSIRELIVAYCLSSLGTRVGDDAWELNELCRISHEYHIWRFF
jgi:hypothetical protein